MPGTGGEPTNHPDFLGIVAAFRSAGMEVGICTNATTLDSGTIGELARLQVRCNVSLDGFAEHSHSRFRARPGAFVETVATVRALAAAGILQGLLCTPNNLAGNQEYAQLCAFAREVGARYVLLNPLGSMGRGVQAQRGLAKSMAHMQQIHALTAAFDGPELDIAHIRFPNPDGKPLAGCEAGTILYVFTLGEVTVCPYLVFAARTPGSQHPDTEFIVGNIFTDADLAGRLENYRFHDRYQLGANPTCGSCAVNSDYGKGCPAAVIAAGGRIGELDAEQCPRESILPSQAGRRLLPLMPA
ncbi:MULTISPECIES: radical SAM protein [unclassified Crossiella]|uniref:radical SAM protein n=1 Tax=unclassified Crossiella TaxID=2620835 RepID=UPI001FFF1822|nr:MULTISPECIES: radical SAM protein [unclassified Crossiella]MCK2241898.1 radical SAM protein [Crossiella sp. S99.2]MCK2255801.1 radical SAM protein [Crossiella sp. S99.1]